MAQAVVNDAQTVPGMAMIPPGLWQGVVEEYTRFLMERLQADLDTHAAMLTCTTPNDVLKIQTEFFQTAFEQYSESSARLVRMLGEAAGQVPPAQMPGLARRYDDVPI